MDPIQTMPSAPIDVAHDDAVTVGAPVRKIGDAKVPYDVLRIIPE